MCHPGKACRSAPVSRCAASRPDLQGSLSPSARRQAWGHEREVLRHVQLRAIARRRAIPVRPRCRPEFASPVLITSTPYRPHPTSLWEPTRRTVFAAGTQPSITRILGCALRSACFTRRQADRSPGRASKSRYSWGFISRIGMVPPVPRPVWPPSGLLRRTRPILSSSSSTQDCGQAPPHSCDRCHTSE